jgi:hypothetical protein
MVKKFVSILMLYCALALMLGHNFIGHHHHDFEHNQVAHHHNDGHHHENDSENKSDSDNQSDDWSHLFSVIQHSSDVLTYLTSDRSTDNFSKQIPQFIAIQVSNFVLNQLIVEVRQNAPPYFSDYYNSQNFLPLGLRAPPISIV